MGVAVLSSPTHFNPHPHTEDDPAVSLHQDTSHNFNPHPHTEDDFATSLLLLNSL